MRLRLSKAKQSPTSILDDGKDTRSSAGFGSVMAFVLRRTVILLVVGIPVLYVSHLLLLAIYSRILSHPHYHELEPAGLHPDLQTSSHNPKHASLRNNHPSHSPLRPPPPNTDRLSDISDTFKTYSHYKQCGVSSLDLHLPIDPLCKNRQSVLDAMSFGGRAGFDQPYIPMGCDFRWYSTEEICTILDRFSHIFIIGDSLQRMVVTALYTFLREDIGLGGIGEWGFKPAEEQTDSSINRLEDCTCEGQFNRHECSHAPVNRYSDAVQYSAPKQTPVCKFPNADTAHPFDISYHEIQKYPATEDEVKELLSAVSSTTEPPKPMAFIFHHTFWNDVNTTATVAWLDQLTSALASHLPFLAQPDMLTHYPRHTPGFARLFTTANAAGIMKNSVYLDSQNSMAIAKFEQELKPHLEFRDIELLGFYNMSIQTTSSDGTHANMRTNLLKAMMVLNWLDWVGKEEGQAWESRTESKEA